MDQLPPLGVLVLALLTLFPVAALVALVCSEPRHLPGTCKDCGVPVGPDETSCAGCADDARQS